MKNYISSAFKTYKGRPIYFDKGGIPWYGTLPNDYLSAVESRPIMADLICYKPKQVETIVKSISTTQDKPKTVYHDQDVIDFDVKKKTHRKPTKDKKRYEREKRKSKKVKHDKENAWTKQELAETTDDDYDDYDDYCSFHYNGYDDDYYDDEDYFYCTRKRMCSCDTCYYDKMFQADLYDMYEQDRYEEWYNDYYY